MSINRIVPAFCFCLLFILSATAQNGKVQLSGRVLDADTKQKIPYVTVIANTPEMVYVEGTATDHDGEYKLELPKGNYVLQFSFIGYKNKEKTIELVGSKDVEILLSSDLITMETVVISGERTSVEQKIDRKVINVGKDLQSGGGDAVEVLNQLSEVQTGIDGGIELRGSGNINLLINGKPSPLAPQDVLQQIDASEIQQIELITTPSAKHRADGLTGIINIITKKKKEQGFSGTLSGSASTNQQYLTGLALSNGLKKVNLSLNLNFADRATESINSRSRISDALNYSQSGDNLFDAQVKSIKAGIDWFLDDKNEFSFSGGYTDNSHDIINTTRIIENAADYKFISNNRHEHLSAEYNANYRRIFNNKNHYLEADLHYTDNRNDLSAAYQAGNNFRDDFLEYDSKVSNFSLDYVQPLGNGSSIETGMLYTIKDVINDQIVNDYDNTNRQNRFMFDEKNLGLYSLIKKEWSNLKGQFGVRYEGFWSESQFENTELQVSRTFHNFFPSAHFTYGFTENNSVNFGYNRRISRPSLRQVNPFSNSFDRFYNRQGNPSLNPEYSNSFEVNSLNSYDKWSFNPGIFYRYKTSIILPLYITNETDNTIFQSYTNDGTSHAYGTEIALSLYPYKFLKTNINGNFYFEKINTTVDNDLGFLDLNNSNLTIKNLFNINKKLSFDITWIYRGASTNRYSKAVETQKFDTALRWKILKGKGSLTFRVTDIFDTFQSESILFGDGFEERSLRKRESRIGYLSFSYQFAKGVITNKRNRKEREFDSGASE
ncbi:TonB-dependent receptor domain-containing protein [Portibacter lacus]|uniref:TonB-dependent receptor n=1 Tax=Portibacter lacus TaxID=1099794 RepID=A0AA37WDX8_9BACT|nr:outer membrane beta-barrel family protein [Portibacter lacus]GLR16094.1 TonB-dependent receptor [Portibacter lacus]